VLTTNDNSGGADVATDGGGFKRRLCASALIHTLRRSQPLRRRYQSVALQHAGQSAAASYIASPTPPPPPPG